MTKPTKKPYYVFTLYISGMNTHSISALKNLKKLCDDYLLGRHEIKIIDLLKEPEKASEKGIFAIPTLIRELPKPVRRIIGDLSNTKQILINLEIKRES